MKHVALCMVVVMTLVFGLAYVAQASSLDDAKALAEKAAAFWKANGKDKALVEFNKPNGSFVKGDLYIVAHDYKGTVIAHGANAALVGTNLFQQKDPLNGKFFVQEEIEVAKTKGSGWVTYSWTNPATKKVQAKKSWIQKIEGGDYLVLCGTFQ